MFLKEGSFILTHLPTAYLSRFFKCFKTFVRTFKSWWAPMFKNNPGRLLVYASLNAPHNKRLKSVKAATEETAKLLNLDFEVISFRKRFSQIYVYYEHGGNAPIPLYCDDGKAADLRNICETLKNMVFVLSFHPKHSGLIHLRKEIMRPSWIRCLCFVRLLRKLGLRRSLCPSGRTLVLSRTTGFLVWSIEFFGVEGAFVAAMLGIYPGRLLLLVIEVLLRRGKELFLQQVLFVCQDFRPNHGLIRFWWL